MTWAGNIAKTMTSKGKQFIVDSEMLKAVTRDQSVQLKVAWCCHCNLSPFFKSDYLFATGLTYFFCYITNHLVTGPLGNKEFEQETILTQIEQQSFKRFRSTKFCL